MMKIIRSIMLAILAIVALLILFLAASIAFDALAGRDRLGSIANLTIPGQGGTPALRAYLARPEGEGPFPAVILIHEFYGLNESIVGKAEGLAGEGYLVLAPDTFRGSTTSWIPRAIYQVITTASEQVDQDLDTVYAWLAAQPEVDRERIAVAGFCYGGRAALSYSLHNNRLAATVVFYGSPVTDAQALRSLPGPLLGIFGEADASIPLEEVRAFEAALEQAGVVHEISIYENQPHAFVTDIETIRMGGVQGQAWDQMVRFLDRTLKEGTSSSRTVEPALYTPPLNFRYYLVLAYEHAFGIGLRFPQHGH